MVLTDIIGPVMVGPSSSHTAGAVRIGNVSRKLLAEEAASAQIYLHGSFLATGTGHGTDRAIVAGILGMGVDDPRIPESFEIAHEQGLDFSIDGIDLGDSFHPNSAKLCLTGKSGKKLTVIASSIGGGRIRVVQIDGMKVNFSGDFPTLIVKNIDKPGLVAEVTSTLERHGINIATMQLSRTSRGGEAVMVLECDREVPGAAIRWLSNLYGVIRVICLAFS